MPPFAMKRRFLISLLALTSLFSDAATLRIEGGRARLSADNDTLAEILRLFERCGVDVRLDPALASKRISGSWNDVETDRLVAQLAAPHNYLLEWKRITGPLGNFDRPASIRIFSGNRPERARPLSNRRKTLDVVEGTNGIQRIRGEILVSFRRDAHRADLETLLDRLGGTIVEVIDPPGLYRIRIRNGLSEDEARIIARKSPGVGRSELNEVFRRPEEAPVSASPELSAALPPNLSIHPGAGAAVAVLDSGFDPRYANLPFIKGTYDAVDPEAPIDDPSGHGTLTTLVAAGAVTPLGSEPADRAVPVVSVRVFDENGMTSSDVLLRALRYAADSGAQIVNMSWSSDRDLPFMREIMDYAAHNGMTLVAAAGNEPTGRPIYPAAYDSVLAVGGLAPDGSRWKNSNFGDFVPIYRPAIARFDGRFYAGTSISAPREAHELAAGKSATKR